MTRLANLPIVAADTELAGELLRKIRRHGYDGRVVDSFDAACAIARQEHPDAFLVADAVGADALSMARTLKSLPGGRAIPVCLIVREASPKLLAEALAAGIDDVLTSPWDEATLGARLRPLVRLATMCEELNQRSRAARDFGLAVESTTAPVDVAADYPLLMVARARPQELDDALSGARVTQVASPAEAEALLADSNFDAVMLLPDGDPFPHLDLCTQIRNNPRLFNLPVLMLVNPGTVGEGTAYQSGANAYFTRPVESGELRVGLLALVRRQRLRWAIRQSLGRTLAAPTRDAATGVYNRAFLDAYLGARVAYAGRHGHQLSLMSFRVPDIETVRREFGGEQADHLRLQVGQWITGLLRAEDLTARFEENEFCVVLPDTPWEEAAVVMHRIAGVLAYTDFAVKDVYQPLKVWVRAGGTDLRPDDDLGRLLGRARQDLAAAV